jgi:hypothetical protein
MVPKVAGVGKQGWEAWTPGPRIVMREHELVGRFVSQASAVAMSPIHNSPVLYSLEPMIHVQTPSPYG